MSSAGQGSRRLLARTQALRNERNRYAALAFCWGDLLLELDESLRVVFATGASAALIGREPDALAGVPIDTLLARPFRALVSEMLEVARRRGRMENIVVRFEGDKGLSPPLSLAGYFLPDLGGHFFLAVRISVDTLPPALADSIVRESESGLLDAESFATVAAERMLAGRDAGQDYQFSLLTLNAFGDLCGRLEEEARTEMVAGIGAFLRANSVAGDSAGRFDSERFGLLHRPEILVTDLERRIADCARAGDPDGVGVVVDAASDTLAMNDFSEADMARGLVYAIRRFCDQQGRDFALRRLGGSLPILVQDTLGAMRDFTGRVAAGDFAVAFQPIVALPTAEIHHFEALLRFADAKGRPVPAPEVIEFAEEAGLITSFDLAMIRKVLTWLRDGAGRELPCSVAVNVSGQSMTDTGFAGELLEMLDSFGPTAQRVMIEVTETAQMVDLDAAADLVAALHKRDIRICLDDFGTGASNFRYLSALAVDYVKIDGQSVRHALASKNGRAFLESLVGLCKRLKVHTIAEMIEDERTLKLVRACGFDYAQGYLFGRPEADAAAYVRPLTPKKQRPGGPVTKGGQSWY